MKLKLLDKIVIGVMILCVLISIQIYYNIKADECISNPLVYGAKQLSERYGYDFTGSGTFLGENLQAPIIYFDKHNITVESDSIQDNEIDFKDYNFSF